METVICMHIKLLLLITIEKIKLFFVTIFFILLSWSSCGQHLLSGVLQKSFKMLYFNNTEESNYCYVRGPQTVRIKMNTGATLNYHKALALEGSIGTNFSV